jgi:hypothetical protein
MKRQGRSFKGVVVREQRSIGEKPYVCVGGGGHMHAAENEAGTSG